MVALPLGRFRRSARDAGPYRPVGVRGNRYRFETAPGAWLPGQRASHSRPADSSAASAVRTASAAACSIALPNNGTDALTSPS